MRVLEPFVVLVFIALVGGACSSGDSDDTSSRDEQSRTAAEEPAVDESDDLTGGQVDLDEGAAQPDDPAAAQAEITANYEKYFDNETPQEEAFALAEDVDEIKDALLAAEEVGAVDGHRTIAVTDVKFTGVDEALVTFDILVDGNPLLEGFVGNAVLDDDGVWKVARSTNCQLAGLAGVNCPIEE